MKLLASILIIAILSGIATYFLPWWLIAVIAFAVSLIMKLKPGKAFLAGFLGIALLWCGWSLWWDIPNQHILSSRLAMVLNLPNHYLFVAVASIVGGLVGGLAAWSGALISLRSSKNNQGYKSA